MKIYQHFVETAIICCMFVVSIHLHLDGVVPVHTTGFFYALSIANDAIPPCNCRNSFYVPRVGIDNGKGGAVLFFASQNCQKIHIMSHKPTSEKLRIARTQLQDILPTYGTRSEFLATTNKLHGFFIAVQHIPDSFRDDVKKLCLMLDDLLGEE